MGLLVLVLEALPALQLKRLRQRDPTMRVLPVHADPPVGEHHGRRQASRMRVDQLCILEDDLWEARFRQEMAPEQ